MSGLAGYAGKFLRVDLTQERLSEESYDEPTLRRWLGGTGIGARILFDEVPPAVAWSDPENRLIMAAGPLNGSTSEGSGAFGVVTKGPLTNAAACSQANGYFGAYLKFSGFDGIIFQGQAKRWVYLYLHDGAAELRDARHLLGKNTTETENLIKKELGLSMREGSVHCIGPAGENLVKLAAIVGDRGHVAGHNGVGAVMGSKKLKAVVATRGQKHVNFHDPQKLSRLAKDLWKLNREDAEARSRVDWGTSRSYLALTKAGTLPVKNLTTNIFPEPERFTRAHYSKQLEMKLNPCWACAFHHCYTVKITDGPYKGYVGEEPDYELMAAFGSVIGQMDPMAAIVLTNEADLLGLEGNETGWIMGWLMECYEKGLITAKDTDGLQMTWGNVPAVQAMLRKIARREGLGAILAEGIVRAAEYFGGEARDCAVYIQKGHAPRGHDHRGVWSELLDGSVSNTGTIETGPLIRLDAEEIPPLKDPFSPLDVSTTVAIGKGRWSFMDSLVQCIFTTGYFVRPVVEMLNAATGWDFSLEEAMRIGFRNCNLLRAFNIRHGYDPKREMPSVRYGSAPVDGPTKGKSIMPHWDRMLDNYYHQMGWDRETGKPLPETLKKYDLDYVIPHLWR